MLPGAIDVEGWLSLLLSRLVHSWAGDSQHMLCACMGTAVGGGVDIFVSVGTDVWGLGGRLGCLRWDWCKYNCKCLSLCLFFFLCRVLSFFL